MLLKQTFNASPGDLLSNVTVISQLQISVENVQS